MALPVLVAGCQALAGEDRTTLYETDLTAYVDESSELRDQIQIERTQIAQSVALAETQSASYRAFNQVLIATVRADQVPTPERMIAIPDGGAMSLEMLNTADGVMRVMQVGVAGFVRPTDNCFDSHQQFFRMNETDRVFMTGLAVNVQPGTRFSVDWVYEGMLVFQNAQIVNNFQEAMCIAIPMTRADVAFSIGNWSATLYVDGSPRNPSAFIMLES